MGFPGQTEGRLRGATARLQFRSAPYPQGPLYHAQYRFEGSDQLQGVMVSKFLEEMSPGGQVHAHVWTHGVSASPVLFSRGRTFRLVAGDSVIADCVVVGAPPAPPIESVFLTRSGLPFDL